MVGGTGIEPVTLPCEVPQAVIHYWFYGYAGSMQVSVESTPGFEPTFFASAVRVDSGIHGAFVGYSILGPPSRFAAVRESYGGPCAPIIGARTGRRTECIEGNKAGAMSKSDTGPSRIMESLPAPIAEDGHGLESYNRHARSA
jgi:hypothetical protein